MAADKKHIKRSDFLKGELKGVEFADPMKMFSVWYQEMIEKNCPDPHAVVFTTASVEGFPASRVVYLRELVEEGFIIYTNYLSRKGTEVAENKNVPGMELPMATTPTSAVIPA